MKWIIVAAIVIAVGLGGGYFYWTTTPLYAFQAIGVSVATHNVEKFKESIDLGSVIDSAIKELITDPIVMTPGLSEPQTKIIEGAAELARPKLAEALADEAIFAINPSAGERPARKPGGDRTLAGEGGPADKVKHAAYEKMSEYAQAHADAIPSKIFRIPKEERKGQLAELFKTYGFTPENFKGAKCTRQESDTSVVEAAFYSPKAGKEVYIDFELKKTATGWRLEKIANLHQTVLALEPTYDRDLQELAMTAAADVRTAVADTVNVIKNKIKEKVADKIEAVREKVSEGIEERLEEKRADIAGRLQQGRPGGGAPGILGRLRDRGSSAGPVDDPGGEAPRSPLGNLRRRFGQQN